MSVEDLPTEYIRGLYSKPVPCHTPHLISTAKRRTPSSSWKHFKNRRWSNVPTQRQITWWKLRFNHLQSFMSITPWKPLQLPARLAVLAVYLDGNGVLSISAMKPGWSSAEWRLINSTHRPSMSYASCQWKSTSILKHNHHHLITAKFTTYFN